MQKMFTDYRKKGKAGYVTIEMIIIAGLLISFGVFNINSLQTHATNISDEAIETVEQRALDEDMWYMNRG